MKPLALAPALAVAVLLAVPAGAATTKTVKVGDDWFGRTGARPTVKVRKGDTVRWVWVGRSVHNVYVTKGPRRFRSKTMAKGTYSKTITTAGTYEIVCTIHPGMEMTLKAS